ncbi:hypothetical protein FGO68_gene2304 [Halteria grandinella]|uniref:Transmembrane protein n=1 Tax=Halteria grandinella TaxID=5974 RepID=A0A8J8NMZ0_HALGN|nr:hypothetical protein FGO68_gene2304 [Halteria grandinella]
MRDRVVVKQQLHKMSGKTSFKDQAIRFIKSLSIGKYHTKLYHRGETYSSSVLGGIFTMVMIITLSIISFYLLDNALTESKKNYSLKQNGYPIKDQGLTLEIYQDSILNAHFMIFRKKTSQQNCSDIYLEVTTINSTSSIYPYNVARIYFEPLSGTYDQLCDLNEPNSQSNASLSFRDFIRSQASLPINYKQGQFNGQLTAPFEFRISNISDIQDISDIDIQFNTFDAFEGGLLKGERRIIYQPKSTGAFGSVDWVTLTFVLSKYRTTSSVLSSGFQEQFIIGTEFQLSNAQIFPYENQTSFEFTLIFAYQTATIMHYTRQPDNIFTVLSKIGGFLALFRVGQLFFTRHIHTFEKKLVQDLNKHREREVVNIESKLSALQCETQESLLFQRSGQCNQIDLTKIREIFSFENFIKMSKDIEELKASNQELRAEVERLQNTQTN